ncbi:hypothetical protein GCM10009720_28010 [Yaniella flava]|uniref:HTH luxR-type domain-containing protein n=1 Tax=Yaniella flava TaxID=287930 RepID=A0ABN2V0E9_9MICC
MTDNVNVDALDTDAASYGYLKCFVEKVEHLVASEDYVTAGQLVSDDPTSAWFGFRTDRLYAIVDVLMSQLSDPGHFLTTVHAVMSNPDPDLLFSQDVVVGSEEYNPRQQYFLAVIRMSAFRSVGLHKDAVEQAEAMRLQQGRLVSVFDRHGGWALSTSVQLGISAMLAGNFHRAVAAFTEAQLHVEVPAFAFLTRDALVKSALIQASFGDPYQAETLLARAEDIPRTSSWAESQIDVHRDFTQILLRGGAVAHEAIERIQLHDVGEMWPFYIVAMYHLMESAGYRDQLEFQLQMFESLPLPKTEGHGFSGSVIPLKRALLAMGAGRGTEAQELLGQADPDIVYTQLIEAASHLYGGRPKEALSRATQLRSRTAGLRLLEVRRLAVIAAANYARDNVRDSLNALEQAAKFPRGLSRFEVQLFSPETRRLAKQHIEQWPQEDVGRSTFLTGLPDPGAALSERELIIIQEIALGHSRAQIAENLYISINTVKSQIQNAYRKLGATSKTSAIREAERRGLL